MGELAADPMGELAADPPLLQDRTLSFILGEAASSLWAELVSGGVGGAGMDGVVLGEVLTLLLTPLAGCTLLAGCCCCFCWLLLMLPCLLSASAGTGIAERKWLIGGR